MHLVVGWADVSGLRRFDNALKAVGSEMAAKIANPALNRAGDMARTKVRQVLPKQTGLKRGVIVKAVKTKRSTPATLSYEMTAQGGDIALKFFAPRETRRGVSAAPFGKRRVFAGSFIRGGRFPNRVPISGFGGHVMERESSDRFPVHVVQSGVIIPVEMVKGATAEAFRTTVATVLPRRVEHEIRRVSGGVIT